MLEIFKSIHHLTPSLVWEFHEKKCIEYILRTNNRCKLPTIRRTNFGLDLLSFKGSFLWNTLLDSIKNEITLLGESSSYQRGIKEPEMKRVYCDMKGKRQTKWAWKGTSN